MMRRANLSSSVALLGLVVFLYCAPAEQTGPSTIPRQSREELSGVISTTPDCNNNGIADTTDVLTGVAEDLNNNGEVDFCDPDSVASALVLGNWVQMADLTDSSYVGIGYLQGELIVVRYTVPRGMHRVTIRVIDRETEKERQLKDTLERQGAYQLRWFPKTDDGRLRLRSVRHACHDCIPQLPQASLEDYNSERPHDSLGRLPPRAFLPRPDRRRESSYELPT